MKKINPQKINDAQPIWIKICGISTPRAAYQVVHAGGDAIGFVFQPSSRRWVSPVHAANISRGLPLSLVRVGVFVDASLEEVAQTVKMVGLDGIQLHGCETPEFCDAVHRQTGCTVIKAVRVLDGSEGSRLSSYRAHHLLLDRFDAKLAGGAGAPFDWTLVPKLRTAAAVKRPVILAGGLTPDNVACALTMSWANGIDVSSGVETSGHKDPAKIRQLISAVRQWESVHHGSPSRVAPDFRHSSPSREK